jgi:hypothetical protein
MTQPMAGLRARIHAWCLSLSSPHREDLHPVVEPLARRIHARIARAPNAPTTSAITSPSSACRFVVANSCNSSTATPAATTLKAKTRPFFGNGPSPRPRRGRDGMGKLEDEVTRDMAGMTKATASPLAGAGVNLEGLDEDERFSLILGRLDSHRNAILRLARRLDQLG